MAQPDRRTERFQKIYSEALLLTGNPLLVCDAIVKWISEVLRVDYAFIECINGDYFTVVSSVQEGEIVREGQFAIAGTPCEHVQSEKEPRIFTDASSEFPKDLYLVEHNIRYYLGVPIFDHMENVIGVLNALGTEIREADPDEIRLMELMAKRASLELEHMQLEEESQRLQRILLDIGQEILQHRSVDDILSQVADGIQTHSVFNLVAISLYHEPIDPRSGEQEKIANVVLGGLSAEDESKLMDMAKVGDFLPSREIIAKGRKIGGGYFVNPELIPELVNTSVKNPTSEEPQSWGPYDDFYIFLEQGSRIIGRISLGDPEKGRLPSEKELEPLNLFANLASLALDKAKSLQELEAFQARLEGIYKWNEQLANCEDIDEMSKVAMQVMSEMFNYDHVSLFRNEGSVLELIGFEAKLPESEFEMAKFNSIPIGQGIVGQVAQKGEAIICRDVQSNPHYIPGHQEIRSEMATPIHESGELLGVLNIESMHINAFGEEDLKLLFALASQLALTIRGIERRQDVEWINRFLQGLNRASYLTDTLELIIQRGIEVLAPKADAGSFLLWNEKTQSFDFAAAVNRDLEMLKNVKITVKGLIAELFSKNRPVILSKESQEKNGISSSFTNVDAPPPASTIALPIREEERIVAVLLINSLHDENVFVDRDAERLWGLISEIELALARARDHEKLRQMAMHDALTNTYNRHFFSEYVDSDRHEELLKEAPISLVMVDIDDFYSVNDRFGHAEGDRTLQHVAELIRQEVRKHDMVVRYGGDEFIIIMPVTTEAQAKNVMERLRSKFENWQPDLPELNLSISFGVASWDPEGADSMVDVLEKADHFMYHRRQERSSDRRAHKQAIIGSSTRDRSADS